MKRLMIFLLAALVITGGCSKKEPTPPLTEKDEVLKHGPQQSPAPESVTLKVGHVGHDHHLALFVACDYANQFRGISGKQLEIELIKIQDQKFYELYEMGQKIADIEIIESRRRLEDGPRHWPRASSISVFGGVAAVIASADSGAPVKLISPLHSKGDMFVVKPDFAGKHMGRLR